MQHKPMPQRGTMNEHQLWKDRAEAQILVVEGNRLIAQAIAEGLRGLWRRVMSWLDVGQRRHLPPI